METFAIYSVAKNHKNSFMQSINEIRKYVDDLELKYTTYFERVKRLSDDKKNYVDSLEAKFHKYNLSYHEPLITNSIDGIEESANELHRELSTSLNNLPEDKVDAVFNDMRSISQDVAAIRDTSNLIDIVSKELLKLEDELSIIRIPEADSKDEVSFDFKQAKKEREDSKDNSNKDDKNISFKVMQNMDDVPNNIFKNESSDDISFGLLNDNLEINDDNDVLVTISNGETLASKAKNVYRYDNAWKDVYNYKENKQKIDNIAKHYGLSSKFVIFSDKYLNNVKIKFPTSFDYEDEIEEEKGRTR